MSVLKYQPHIDGLRAVAVLSVIVFHLNANWLPSGFVGVDFFFVISGFLITNIILIEQTQGTFTLKHFYLRRIKRILPVLALVAITCFVAGYFLLLNYDFRYLRRSVTSTWFFYSNIFFMGEGDYFAQNLLEAPLLHTWSLSIEEQFYLLWPTVLAGILLLGKHRLIPVCIVLLVASFGFSVLAVFIDVLNDHSYFLLPSRFWELLLGSLLAMCVMQPFFLETLKARPVITAMMPVIACVLLFWSVFGIDKNLGFPGWQAALPCLSAALFILSGLVNQQHFIVRILSSKPLVLTGLLSYSLYLWHWPVLAFIRYVTIETTLTVGWMLLAVLLTVVLSVLSYHLVEKPFRKVKWSFRKSFVIIYVLPLLLVTLLNQGYKDVLGRQTLHHTDNLVGNTVRRTLCPDGIAAGCRLGDLQQDTPVVLIGDSHAEHVVPFFNEIAKQGKWSFRVYSRIACVYFLGVPDEVMKTDFALSRKYCPDMQSVLLQQLSERPHTIIFSSRWSIHPGVNDEASALTMHQRRALFERGLEQILLQGHRIVLVSEVPAYNKSIQRKKAWPNISGDLVRLNDYQRYNRYLQELADRHDNIFYLDISRFAEQFENGTYHGEYMYFDSNHLTYEGSLALAKLALENGIQVPGLQIGQLKL